MQIFSKSCGGILLRGCGSGMQCLKAVISSKEVIHLWKCYRLEKLTSGQVYHFRFKRFELPEFVTKRVVIKNLFMVSQSRFKGMI